MTSSSLIAELPAPARSGATKQTLATVRVLGAAGLLFGVFLAYLGFAWDVQWHTDVGPDTFFTAPHLVLYGGIAISGLTCLAVVLLTTRYSRGTETALEGTTAIFNGAFRAPLGYIVSGFGALFFLLYGLMDQWWHSLYGFDVTLVSPPHVGLILSIMVTMAGCLIALAWHVRTASARGAQRFLAALGTAFAAAVLVAFITPTLTDLQPWEFVRGVSWPNCVVSALYPAALLMVASIIRRPWAATLFGLCFTALDLFSTAVVPVITRDYAASLGLFLRDTTTGDVIVSGLIPSYLIIAGLVVDVLLEIGRLRAWSPVVVVPFAGAAAALTLRLLEADLPLYQPSAFDPAEIAVFRAAHSSSVAMSSLLLAPVIGAVAGWFGWLLGVLLATSRLERPGQSPPLKAAAASAILVLLVAGSPLTVQAHASDPHHELLQAGPYAVTVGFSEWPIQAERSLDITFEPEGGIANKTATIRITDPHGDWYEVGPLGRHPRQRTLWGLDLISLPESGNWTIELTVNGMEGIGTGTLSGITVGPRPGPPPTPMWLIAALPLVFLIWLGVRGWLTVRPGRLPESRVWSPSDI